MTLVTEKQIEHGFWFWDKQNNFPPESISYPSQYNGESKVNIACTQRNDLTATEQKKLVNEWCNFLPQCKNIEMLWFTTTTPQILFDCACSLDQLIGFNIKNSKILTLDKIKNLIQLKYLRIGESQKIESIEPVKELVNLEVLVLESLKKISNFSAVSQLQYLKFLTIEGGMYTKQKVESFEPIGELTNLVYFSTAMISIANKSIQPILKLKKLVTLNWPFSLTEPEIKKLKTELPNLKYLPHRYDQNNQDKLKELFR